MRRFLLRCMILLSLAGMFCGGEIGAQEQAETMSCPILDGYLNSADVLLSTEFTYVFGADIPKHPSDLLSIYSAGKMIGWETSLRALLVLSTYYSRSGNEQMLKEVGGLLATHPSFEANIELAISDTRAGQAWLAKDAVLAEHQLNYWLLTHDDNYLSASLESTSRFLQLIGLLENNMLGGVLATVWEGQQEENAETAYYRNLRSIAEPLVFAHVFRPDLVSALKIKDEKVRQTFDAFGEVLKLDKAEYLRLWSEPPLAFYDTPETTDFKVSEYVWQARLQYTDYMRMLLGAAVTRRRPIWPPEDYGEVHGAPCFIWAYHTYKEILGAELKLLTISSSSDVRRADLSPVIFRLRHLLQESSDRGLDQFLSLKRVLAGYENSLNANTVNR